MCSCDFLCSLPMQALKDLEKMKNGMSIALQIVWYNKNSKYNANYDPKNVKGELAKKVFTSTSIVQHMRKSKQ